MNKLVRFGNATLIFVIVGVILSAVYQQYTKQGPPCPLCLLQRLAMIGVATGAMMNLLWGIRMEHYGMSFLSAILGGSVSVRQVLLHICPTFPEFGYPVLGLSLFTWAFIVFVCCILALVLFIFLYRPESKKIKHTTLYERLAVLALILVTIVDMGIVFTECGLGKCPDPPWPPANSPTALYVPACTMQFAS